MGMVNFVLQLLAAMRIAFGSLPERMGTALVAVLGFAGVVLVLTGMLSIREGFERTLESGGRADVAMVLRGGASSELASGITLDESRIIATAPGIRADAAGPIVSPEMLVILDVKKRSTGQDANVPVRGYTERAFLVHDKLRVIEGRTPEPGRNELMVGRQAAAQFQGLEVGGQVRSGSYTWDVVGIFAAGGGLEESELWADARVLQDAFNRGTGFQAAYVVLESPDAMGVFKDALTSNPQLNVNVQRHDEFLAEQTRAMGVFITVAGTTIAILMGIGAIFGAINAMYTTVVARTREIGTLRALGFGRLAVFLSVLVEAMLLGALGGVLGGAAAWLVFNGYQASTLNFMSFSQVSFQFAVTGDLLIEGLTYALVLGLVGGVLPAARAARLPIAASLRQL